VKTERKNVGECEGRAGKNVRFLEV